MQDVDQGGIKSTVYLQMTWTDINFSDDTPVSPNVPAISHGNDASGQLSCELNAIGENFDGNTLAICSN